VVTNRPRAIVELAAHRVRNPSTRSWLFNDERGSWETAAREYLEKTADRAAELGLSADTVDREIADRLCHLALMATLATTASRKPGKL